MTDIFRQWLFWAAAAACAIAELAIIVSSLRSLRGSKPGTAARETMWAVLPAIVLAWLLAATLTEVRRGQTHEHMTMPMPASTS